MTKYADIQPAEGQQKTERKLMGIQCHHNGCLECGKTVIERGK